MKSLVLLSVLSAMLVVSAGCSGGDSGAVPVGDAQTKGGNVVQDAQLKEQMTGAANKGGDAPSSDGPQVTQ